MGECRSCRAPGIWAVTEKSGKPILVDNLPVEGGNILLRHTRTGDPPVAHVTTKAEREQLDREHRASPQEGPLKLFVAHFTTCPDAGDWRKP